MIFNYIRWLLCKFNLTSRGKGTSNCLSWVFFQLRFFFNLFLKSRVLSWEAKLLDPGLLYTHLSLCKKELALNQTLRRGHGIPPPVAARLKKKNMANRVNRTQRFASLIKTIFKRFSSSGTIRKYVQSTYERGQIK